MRIRALAAAALATASLSSTLAACSSGGGDAAGEKQTVTMWIYPVIADQAKHQAFWDEQAKAFEAANPAIDVKVEIYPWAKRDEALATAIAGNKAPDVVYLIPDQLPKYAKTLEPVDGYLTDKGDYRDNALKSVTMDGKVLGAPILMSSNPLVCNQKAFDAAGVTEFPKTWDDLMKLAPAFKAKDIDVTNYWADPAATLNQSFYPLLWQAGGDVFAPDGKSVAFGGPEGVKALTLLKQLADGGFVEKDLLTGLPKFEQTRTAQNKVACTWQQLPGDVESFWGKENVKVQPPLTGAKQVAYGTVGSLSLLKGSDVKEAAGKWIGFATGAAPSKSFNLASNYFSPRKSTGALYAADPVQSAVEQTLDLTTAGPLHEKARDVMGVLAPEIQAALIGKKTPEQALADATAAADALLGR
ncbi:sugar ABC transporter substrate-binding protein [Nonomuraea sp. NPDC050310]|uniref:ABC transporter substrate-binding protein n=1 Tax=Nonomuraea sp. NPDC050310 TaxID=3154935 RepID=UPI003403BA80